MHAITHPIVTTHGLKKLEMERADLRDWLENLKSRVQNAVANHKKDKEIELILSEGRVVASRLKRTNVAYGRAMTLPRVWGHKNEARAGDTVYLCHKDTIRGLVLASAWNADPENGRVSVVSPIGLALVGRHPGDKVRINTLDGDVEYRILKIV